jgi:hypothetical protein
VRWRNRRAAPRPRREQQSRRSADPDARPLLAQALRKLGAIENSLLVRTTWGSAPALSAVTPDQLWKSSRPTASSSVARVAGHAGGAGAAERRPCGRPSTAGFHQFGPCLRRGSSGHLCPTAAASGGGARIESWLLACERDSARSIAGVAASPGRAGARGGQGRALPTRPTRQQGLAGFEQAAEPFGLRLSRPKRERRFGGRASEDRQRSGGPGSSWLRHARHGRRQRSRSG